MQIVYTRRYYKSFKKLSKPLQLKTIKKVELFIQNPTSKVLRNHALQGVYAWMRSIDITGDVRLVFRKKDKQTYELLEFIDIGTHSQLY